MKKMNMLIGFLLLCGTSFIGAMERELVPFRDIQQKQYGTISRDLEYHLLVVAINQLSPEIQGIIVKKMCAVADEKVLKIPIQLGLKFYDELRELQKIGPIELGDKIISAAQLFQMPSEKRGKFLSIAKPSFLKKLSGAGRGVLTSKDYDAIIEFFPEKDVPQGIRVVKQQPLYEYSGEIVGGLIFLAGLGFGVADYFDPSLDYVLASWLLGLGGPTISALFGAGHVTRCNEKAEPIEHKKDEEKLLV